VHHSWCLSSAFQAPGEENFERLKERKGEYKAGVMEIETDKLTLVNAFASARQGEIHSLGHESDAQYADVTITADAGIGMVGDQTYMTQDDEEADLMQRRPNSSSVVGATKQPLKSAMKKPGNEAVSASSRSAKPAPAAAPAKGRITAAEKRKREVSKDMRRSTSLKTPSEPDE
jgi:hypothetical protein